MKYPDRAVSVYLLAATLAAGAIYSEVQNISQSNSEIERKRTEFLTKKVSVFAGMDDSGFLETNYSSFTDMLGRNSSDSKGKVEWIKLLKSAKSQLDLTEMSFDIYPARSITQNQDELLVSISVEVIELKLSLLHDGKISEFMNYLNANAPNNFVVTALEINRIERKVDSAISPPKMVNLEVLCTIEWYSIDMIGNGNDVQS